MPEHSQVDGHHVGALPPSLVSDHGDAVAGFGMLREGDIHIGIDRMGAFVSPGVCPYDGCPGAGRFYVFS